MPVERAWQYEVLEFGTDDDHDYVEDGSGNLNRIAIVSV